MGNWESLEEERAALSRLEREGALRAPLFAGGVFQPDGFKLHAVLERLVIDGRARRLGRTGGAFDAAYVYSPAPAPLEPLSPRLSQPREARAAALQAAV